MNKTDFYKNNFFLVEHNAQLLYGDSKSLVKEVRKVRVIYDNDNRTCVMYIDERFNDLEFRGFDNITDEATLSTTPSKDEKVIDYLTKKYNELKSTDFRYKSGDGYEGSKILYLEDFITYLKSENRETIINNTLE